MRYCTDCGRKFKKVSKYQRLCPVCLKEKNGLVYARLYPHRDLK